MSEMEQDDKPPLFRSWGIWYLVVAGFLLLQVLLYAFFTKHFS
jgi:hypothetical protein